MRALRALIPPREKSLRQSRTVSSRTPEGLRDPRNRPAVERQKQRTRPVRLRTIRALRQTLQRRLLLSSVAITGDLPAMQSLPDTIRKLNHRYNPLASPSQPA